MSYRFAGGGPRSSSCTSSPVAGAAPGRASLGGFSPSPDDCRPSTRGPKGASLALGTAGLSWLCDRWFLRTASPGGADAPWSQRRRPLLLGLRIGESASASIGCRAAARVRGGLLARLVRARRRGSVLGRSIWGAWCRRGSSSERLVVVGVLVVGAFLWQDGLHALVLFAPRPSPRL